MTTASSATSTSYSTSEDSSANTIALRMRVDADVLEETTVSSVEVSSSAPSGQDGVYWKDDTITFKVTFSEDIDADGAADLRLEANVGGTVHTLSPATIGDDSVSFEYTVAENDLDTDGVSVPEDGLSMTSGMLEDIYGNDVDLDIDATGFADAKVDALAARVTKISLGPTLPGNQNAPPNTFHDTGDTLTARVQFSKPVQFTFKPTVTLNVQIGENLRAFTWTPTQTIETVGQVALTYTVVAEDSAANGDVSVAANALSLSVPGSASDPQGLDPDFDHAAQTFDRHPVNPPAIGIAEITEVEPSGHDGIYVTGETITVHMEFDDNVAFLALAGNSTLTLDVGGEQRTATTDSNEARPSQAGLRFTYTVQEDDVDANGIEVVANSFTLPSGEILADRYNRNADLTHEAVTLDKALVNPPAPTITDIEVTSTPVGGFYSTASGNRVIDFDVTFSEAVTVSNLQQGAMKVDVGGSEKSATVLSASGKVITFRYVVLTGHRDTDGVSVPENALVLPDGATIQGVGSRDANLDSDAKSFPGHKVNPTPDAPGDLEAAPDGADAILLTWQSAPDHGVALTGYEYRQSDDDGVSWSPDWTAIPDSDATTTAFRIDGLAPAQAYTFEVRAVNAAGKGIAASASAVTQVVAPGAPSDVEPYGFRDPAAEGLGNGQVDLVFRVPERDGGAALSYQVRWKEDGGTFGDWTAIPGDELQSQSNRRLRWFTTGLPVTTYAHRDRDNVPAGYTFEVRAVNSAGAGPAASGTLTPIRYWFVLRPLDWDADAPAPVIEEGASARFEMGVEDNGAAPGCAFPFNATLQWTATDPGGYLDAASGSLLHGACESVRSFTVTTTDDAENEAEDGEVTVTLSSVSLDLYLGDTPPSARFTVRDNDDTAPEAPGALLARAGNTEVRLTWTAPFDGTRPITGYELRYAQGAADPTGSWTPIADSDAETTSHTVGSLTNDQLYTFQVRAVNEVGAGAAATASATPIDGVPVSFAAAVYSAPEGDEVEVTVTLGEAPVAGSTVTVQIEATPGENLESNEYSGVPAQVVFSPGQTARSFTVDFRGDGVDERNETLTLAIGTLPEGYVVAPPYETVLTLVDDDHPLVTASFGAESATAPEGGAVEVLVTLDRVPEREVVLPLVATRGPGLAAGDYEGVPDSVTFAADETGRRFTVVFDDDDAVEDDETLTLSFGTRPEQVNEGAPERMALTVQDDDGPPAAPDGLSASTGDGFVTLSWEPVANDAPVTRYEARWTEVDGGFWGPWTSAGLETTLTVRNLVNGAEHQFQVRAVNRHGNGFARSVTATPSLEITAIPHAPQNLKVRTDHSSYAHLTWAPPSNAWQPLTGESKLQGYRVEVCRASCDDEANWHALAANTRSVDSRWVHEALAPGAIRENRYRVRAININGRHGPWSNVATLPATETRRLAVYPRGETALEVQLHVLNHPDGTMRYVRYRKWGTSDPWRTAELMLLATGLHTVRLTSLEPETGYEVQLDDSPDFASPQVERRTTGDWRNRLPGHGGNQEESEATRVEIDVNGDGRADRGVRLALAMGETVRYRLRLAARDGYNCAGEHQVQADAVRYQGVGGAGAYAALMRYAGGLPWAVLECGDVETVRAPTEEDPCCIPRSFVADFSVCS